MRRVRIGMRWWLAGMFVVIAALTALILATVSSQRTGQALQANWEDLALGKTVSAAFDVDRAVARGTLARQLPSIARRHGLRLYVFGADGRLIARSRRPGSAWADVPAGAGALRTALAGRRFVHTSADTRATLAALPLHESPNARALVAYAPRPALYGRSLAIFHREVIHAALWAVGIALALGLLAASLVARRLGQIATAAAAIEHGNFGVRLQPVLHDEVGALAATIDRMRRRLHTSFEQLRGERDRLELLLEQLHEGLIAFDQQLVVRFANPRARELLAGTLERSDDRVPETWAGVPLRTLATRLFDPDASVSESRGQGEDGRAFAVAGVPAGGADLAVIVITDITEQERRERAEREFVANASHELRTPVTAISGAVEALLAGAKDSPADREAFIALIGRQAARLGRLARSLLILARSQARQEAVQLEPLEVRLLLEDVIRATDRGGEIGVDCRPGLMALAQRDLAEQVFSSLVDNALRHGGDARVRLAAHQIDGHVVVEVRDSGPGIPAEVRERIFDRFYSGGSARRQGFGLGLAIVQDAVRAVGGKIEIESSDGRGTTARVVLAGRREP